MIQITIIKIKGYGPWTLTLGADREHELQMLQASLYKEIQKLFSDKNCLTFQNRCDEFFVVSNGINISEHATIQEILSKKFADIQLAISVGVGNTPFEANVQAHKAQRDQIQQGHGIYSITMNPQTTKDNVRIMHLDVDGLTKRGVKDTPYEITCEIFGLYHRMSKYFIERGALSFFMGGDNFMVIASDKAKEDVSEFLKSEKNAGITINCGIGQANTGRKAAHLATKSLDIIRNMRDSNAENKIQHIYEIADV